MEGELGEPEPHGRKDRARPVSIEEILSRYTAGYWPYPDPAGDSLHWERKEVRAMIPLNEETVARALRLLRTIRPPYVTRQNRAVETVLARLSNEAVKPGTWIRGPVIPLY